MRPSNVRVVDLHIGHIVILLYTQKGSITSTLVLPIIKIIEPVHLVFVYYSSIILALEQQDTYPSIFQLIPSNQKAL